MRVLKAGLIGVAVMSVLGIASCLSDNAKLSADKSAKTEIEPSDFTSKCLNGNEELCKGKFIVWDGTINEGVKAGSSSLDLQTVDGHGTVSLISAVDQDLDSGTRIIFHARISKLNSFSADEYVDGYVRQVIASGTEIKQQKNQEEARKSQLQAEKDREKDTVDAQNMGVSLEEYLAGKASEITAWVTCQTAVKRTAQWGSSADWTPNFSWSVAGDTINITGHDVTMKNGFGGSRDVSYDCSYTMATKIAVVNSVN